MRELLFCHLIAFFVGFVTDLIFGDPQIGIHPIRLIGRLITFLEKHLYKAGKEGLIQGAILVNYVIIISFFVTGAISLLAYRFSFVTGIVVEGLLTWFILSVKSLYTESMKVYMSLNKNDIELAKAKLSMIVGRDTNVLEGPGIINATVETVAENTCDGVIAPLIYTAIGGPVLGMLYKAINTMDSMIAYKNERYEYFGKVAAKIDDFVNFIPARIAAIIMIIATVFVRDFNTKRAIGVFFRDRNKSTSPNAGQCEAVVAGGLGIRLLGPATYGGVVVEKPYIGDGLREPSVKDILLTNRLMITGAILLFLLCGGALFLVYVWIG